MNHSESRSLDERSTAGSRQTLYQRSPEAKHRTTRPRSVILRRKLIGRRGAVTRCCVPCETLLKLQRLQICGVSSLVRATRKPKHGKRYARTSHGTNVVSCGKVDLVYARSVRGTVGAGGGAGCNGADLDYPASILRRTLLQSQAFLRVVACRYDALITDGMFKPGPGPSAC